MSHSKRNTSRPDFTSYERSLVRNSWGSQRTRLTRDSYLPFGSCGLCLLPAREPVACASNGDLFCRECAVSDLLAQRKEIKRLEKEREREQDDKQEEKLREEESQRQKELLEFERSYMNMERQNKRKRDDEVNGGRDTKRRELEDGEEKKKADKASSFWIPGALSASGGTDESAKPAKLHPICPASTPTNKHPYSLKTLITVSFTAEHDSQCKSTVLVCPSCKKALSNSAKAILTKPCGHVICRPCAEHFMKPDEKPDPHANEKQELGVVRCYVCEADVTERKSKKTGKEEKDKIRPGLIQISCEGTGFAGVGTNVAEKKGVAFLG